jgi:RNA polymerase sigma-70 factor (ECF subfamily)
MDRYARGDDAAFGVLYDLVAPRVYAFLLRRTLDHALAEDLTQNTFLNMHAARRHFAWGAAVMPWAFAIARRVLIDAHRWSGKRKTEDDGEAKLSERPCGLASIDGVVGKRRLLARVVRELERVPEDQRVAFELMKLDGFSAAEAAEALGTTVAAVKLRAFRACEVLRGVLGDALSEELGDVWRSVP